MLFHVKPLAECFALNGQNWKRNTKLRWISKLPFSKIKAVTYTQKGGLLSKKRLAYVPASVCRDVMNFHGVFWSLINCLSLEEDYITLLRNQTLNLASFRNFLCAKTPPTRISTSKSVTPHCFHRHWCFTAELKKKKKKNESLVVIFSQW